MAINSGALHQLILLEHIKRFINQEWKLKSLSAN